MRSLAFISSAAALSVTRDAAVVVPGFLEGAAEFVGVAGGAKPTRHGPDDRAPIHRWHWIPCLGGRSVRPPAH